MTAFLYAPGDWAVMLEAVERWASACVDVKVVWARQRVGEDGQTPPAPKRPYVVLDLASPPSQTGHAEIRRLPGVVVVLDQGGPYAVEIDGIEVGVPAGPVDEARITLAQAIAASDAEATAQPIAGTTGLLVRSTRNAPPMIIREIGQFTKLKVAKMNLGNQTATFTAEIVTALPRAAAAYALRLRQGLETESKADLLRAGGWAPIDTQSVQESGIQWAEGWEDRSRFDFRLTCRSLDLELLDYIEQSAIVGTITA